MREAGFRYWKAILRSLLHNFFTPLKKNTRPPAQMSVERSGSSMIILSKWNYHILFATAAGVGLMGGLKEMVAEEIEDISRSIRMRNLFTSSRDTALCFRRGELMGRSVHTAYWISVAKGIPSTDKIPFAVRLLNGTCQYFCCLRNRIDVVVVPRWPLIFIRHWILLTRR